MNKTSMDMMGPYPLHLSIEFGEYKDGVALSRHAVKESIKHGLFEEMLIGYIKSWCEAIKAQEEKK